MTGLQTKIREFFNSGIWTSMLNHTVDEIEEYHMKEAEWLREFMLQYKPGRVLDVGCGSGESIAPISDLEMEIYGIDIAERQLEIAAERFQGNTNVHLMQCDASQMPADWTNKFDVAYCMGAGFGNMEGLQMDVLREMIRVTKPNGRIVISVYSEHAKEAQRAWYTSIGLQIVDDSGDCTLFANGMVSERFTKGKLYALAERLGLEVEIEELTPIAYIAVFHQKV
ncbi:hypothetical protein DRJ48_01275 [Candidatus Woesearchaeota archaeon]|nr:MAG: hypothetical protein DRJ48_01275 [Candidatus Woesearchaeota archaeon]